MDEATLIDRHTVLLVDVGAHACGVGADESEVDSRGVYAAPADLLWGFEKPPSSVPGPGVDRLNWELEQFCLLALRAEPVALEALASDRITVCTALGDELRELRAAFLSQRVADSFRRETAREFARAAAAAHTGGTPRHAAVAEVIRLLVIAESVLRTGELTLDLRAKRDFLAAVREGEVPWIEVASLVEGLRDQTVAAVLRSPLPVDPDIERVERWLKSVRLRSITTDPHPER